MVQEQHPESEVKEVFWCLGEACPPHMMLPEDWDVLGQVPNDGTLRSAETPKSVETPGKVKETRKKTRELTSLTPDHLTSTSSI